MQDGPADGDPAPEAPLRPSIEDCCQGGCTRCVFDLYDERWQRYSEALSAWRARRGTTESGA